MDNITVYYNVYKDDDGETRIITTEEGYWNRHHCVDDGSGAYFETICDAIENCGAEETCESEFILDYDVSVDYLIAKMKEKGFNMVDDTAFNEFLNNHD